MKQLKIGTTVLTVEGTYPFRYDFGKGKEVLRVEVAEANHDFAELLVLKDCEESIEYYEDEVLKIAYSNYSMDFNCQYNAGVYSIELTRKSEQDIQIQTLKELVDTLIIASLEV